MEARDPAFESVLEHSNWLHQLARSLVRDGHRAEDAVQETLLEAFERRGQALASPRSWLGAVLRNRLRAERRSRIRRDERERLAEQGSADRSAARHGSRRRAR
jgi:RNA polymerase sigma-70 factor (ECF subfamily)